ncbi:MAG TPA: hypothetical protein VFD32_18245 [Dehalococcoidia bacterium]|nr:hypothetical protein [Dehalococcoidia bacterium]
MVIDPEVVLMHGSSWTLVRLIAFEPPAAIVGRHAGAPATGALLLCELACEQPASNNGNPSA